MTKMNELFIAIRNCFLNPSTTPLCRRMLLEMIEGRLKGCSQYQSILSSWTDFVRNFNFLSNLTFSVVFEKNFNLLSSWTVFGRNLKFFVKLDSFEEKFQFLSS